MNVDTMIQPPQPGSKQGPVVGQTVVDSSSTEALQMSPYLALVMAFVSSAEAEEAVQKQAAESLGVQDKAMNEVEAAQQAMTAEGGPSPSATALEASAYMQSMISQSQVLDAKTNSINMSIQSTVQLGVTNSAQREQADLQQGSEINRVLQNLVR